MLLTGIDFIECEVAQMHIVVIIKALYLGMTLLPAHFLYCLQTDVELHEGIDLISLDHDKGVPFWMVNDA